jgi:hypothetical protein
VSDIPDIHSILGGLSPLIKLDPIFSFSYFPLLGALSEVCATPSSCGQAHTFIIMSNEEARDLLTTTKEGKENNAVGALLPHAPDEDVEAKTETSENNWPRKSSRAKKKSAKLCSGDRCTNAAVNDGMCKRHGAEMTNKLCSAEGCTNYAVNKQGFCVRHGHGAKTPVIPPPPSYPPPGYLRFAECVQSGKNDTKSDQGGEISAAGGTKRKRSSGEEEAPKKDGKKYKKKPKCSHDGCTNSSIKRGVCWRHGAKNLVNNRKRCSAEGCKNHVHKGEVCIHHWAKSL